MNLQEKISTNNLSHKHPIQRWANFIAGYSIEFVEQCLSSRNKDEDCIIDPFLGCGTTLVASKNLGFRGVGFDRHDVFFNLAKAKLSNYSINELNVIADAIQNSQEPISWSLDARKYLKKLYSEDNLSAIAKASKTLGSFNSKLQPLAIAFLLKTCEISCGSQTDGIYKAPTSSKKSIPFRESLDITFKLFSEDILSKWYQSHWIEQPSMLCFNKSSTNMIEVKTNSIGMCITSPPYLNNFDYAEMTRMHLYILGWASSWGEISKIIRNDLITNTTTALKNKKTIDYQNQCRDLLPHSLQKTLKPIVEQLQIERKNRAGKKDYNYLVYPYYAQIQSVLLELFRVLKTRGVIHWVIADAALYGVHIKTHIHTAELMRSIGFKDVKIIFIRKRGHRWKLKKRDGAEEGLGEYHVIAHKE